MRGKAWGLWQRALQDVASSFASHYAMVDQVRCSTRLGSMFPHACCSSSSSRFVGSISGNAASRRSCFETRPQAWRMRRRRHDGGQKANDVLPPLRFVTVRMASTLDDEGVVMAHA